MTTEVHRIGVESRSLAVIAGVVEHGDQRGRTLGFPTANVRMGPEHGAVDDGVYAAIVTMERAELVAAVSIGRRPTFYAEGDRLCEAHLLDFAADVYGLPITVALHHHIRAQARFEALDALVAQLRRDVDECRRLLGADPLPSVSQDRDAWS